MKMADEAREVLPFRQKADFDETFPFGDGFVNIKANSRDLKDSLEREFQRWKQPNSICEWTAERDTKEVNFVFVSGRKERGLLQLLPELLAASAAAVIKWQSKTCEVDISKVVAHIDKQIKGRTLQSEEKQAHLLSNLGGFWSSTRFALLAEANKWKGVDSAYRSVTLDYAPFLATFSLAAAYAVVDTNASPAVKVWNAVWVPVMARTALQLVMIGGSLILPERPGRPVGGIRPVSIPRQDDPLPFQVTFEK